MNTWQTSSDSPETTEALAAAIGKRLKGGEVIELVSDLGGGKTAFVRGLARGLGSEDHVASPTFTISREYHADKLTLYHFDFYRLHDPGIMAAELAEFIDDPGAVVAIEWSDVVRHVLPEKRLTVRLKLTGEQSREISFEFSPELGYLLAAVIPGPVLDSDRGSTGDPVKMNSANNKLDSRSGRE
jgi:tRNA threonylcarbamoyladenosine biosynthesis protein TsaE